MSKRIAEHSLEERRNELRLGNFSYARYHIDRIMKELGMWKWWEDGDYQRLCRDFLVMEVKSLEKRLRILDGDYPEDEIETPVIQVVEKKQEQEEPSELLSVVINKYLEETRRTVRAKAVDEYEKCLALMVEIVGDMPIKRLDGNRKVIREFRENLLKYPSNKNKKREYRDKSLSEILEMVIPERDLLSITSVNKYIIRASAFFNYARLNGYINSNPSESMTVTDARRDDEKRLAYEPDELKTLFCSKKYLNDSFHESFQFWVPIIGLFTGCRLEEICQLHLDDIREERGVLIFDINDKEEKRIKTPSAKRIVPIHPFLINDLKFLDHVKHLEGTQKGIEPKRLFPELSLQRDGYSGRVSKWFGRYRDAIKIVVPENAKKDFHSFRTTFINNCKQNMMDTVLLAEIVGHSNESETTGRYGKRYRAEVMYTEIVSRVVYEGLDLSHLRKSKFVPNGINEGSGKKI
jgi:integrase